MIPKIIHYCWFGPEELPELTKKCIESWKNLLPDYEIMEWTESNTDLEHSIPYVKEAYAEGKYAFVSDYYRLKAIYEYGGVYLDADYEILKPMDKLLSRGSLISGFESDRSILTAFIAAEKGNPIIREFMDTFLDRRFIIKDNEYDLTPINVGFSKILENHGINLDEDRFQKVDQTIIYPKEILCGFDVKNWHEKITPKTLGVHHMSSSWQPESMKRYFRRIKLIQRIIGYRAYDFLKTTLYDRLKAFIKR